MNKEREVRKRMNKQIVSTCKEKKGGDLAWNVVNSLLIDSSMHPRFFYLITYGKRCKTKRMKMESRN